MSEPSTPRTRYEYWNLESDHIRLLRVVSADDVIKCHIEHISLDRAPNYHALSYVWGDEEQDVEILLNGSSGERSVRLPAYWAEDFTELLSILNGGGERQDFEIRYDTRSGWQSFYITAHLAAAIRMVAGVLDLGSKHEPVYLWVDAICINQDDLIEKATQVPLIGHIYANASMVCIWLGEPSRDALIAMTILQLLLCNNQIMTTCSDITFIGGEIYTKTCSDKTGLEIAQRNAIKFEQELFELGFGVDDLQGLVNVYNALVYHPGDKPNFETTNLQNRLKSLSLEQPILKPDHPIWSILLTFFSHPWFSRVWTLQEGLLAKEGYVMSGHNVIPWDHYRNVRLVLLSERCIHHVYSAKMARDLGLDVLLGERYEFHPKSRVNGVYEFHSSDRLVAGSWHLNKLLLGLVRRHARVEKDYIYGILGIVNEGVRQQIDIDYSSSTSTATVFAQATRLACEMDEDPTRYWNELIMVYYGTRKPKVEGLPSWCPDFSNAGMNDDAITCLAGPHISKTVGKKYKSYARLEFSLGINTLIVSGFRLDYVEEFIPTPNILSFKETHTFLSDLDTEIDDSTFCRIFGAEQLKWLNDMESAFAARGNSNGTPGGWPRRFLCRELNDEQFEKFERGLRKVKTVCASMIENGTASVAEACAEVDITKTELAKMLRYVRVLPYFQCGKQMFRTVSGRLGYAPLPVSPGDSICFLPNAMLLHVLSHDCTRRVTFASVEGFMGDDLLDIVPNDQNLWQEFHLS